ncbi:MAG TPA: DUF4381 domain-containing protein [Dongiaceae bacterium]|nr:DUF4381 domain-containing protein [Dongiaceae bacterium]
MNSADLSKLHDFSQPPPPSWMPHTIGWYVLFALFFAAAVFLSARALRRWIRNRYRRDALRQIQLAPVAQLSEILKRTALVSWSRPQVASLTGKDWIDFLASSSGLDAFRSVPGDRIESIALSGSDVSAREQQHLKQLAADWVRLHHV